MAVSRREVPDHGGQVMTRKFATATPFLSLIDDFAAVATRSIDAAPSANSPRGERPQWPIRFSVHHRLFEGGVQNPGEVLIVHLRRTESFLAETAAATHAGVAQSLSEGRRRSGDAKRDSDCGVAAHPDANGSRMPSAFITQLCNPADAVSSTLDGRSVHVGLFTSMAACGAGRVTCVQLVRVAHAVVMTRL